MSSALSITSSTSAAAILRQQLPAGAAGSVNQATDENPAVINSISAGAAPRSNPGAPAAAASTPATPPDADPTNQIAQQNAVSQKNAAIAKAIQSGSSAISSFLDIRV
jgi:hypothetical protein